LSAKTRNTSLSCRRLQVLSLAFVIFLTGMASAAVDASDALSPLRRRLAVDGFKPQEIRLLDQAEPELMYKTVSRTLIIRESKLNYDQFLSASAIASAQEFRRRNGHLLLEAEAAYGVDQCVIVAILLVETHFGSYTGKTPTVAVLTTFALMDQKSNRDKVWSLLPAKDKKRWDRAAFDRKLMDRSNWAYQELCALLRLAGTQTVQITSCRGSVMGAIGWPQFLPSSLVRYGVDGNRDGRIDLFDPADAVFSVANYLKGYGWSQASNQAGKEEVIYAYNHSRPYVQAILGVAAKLRQSGNAAGG
jgi:membrane-bound lytic murein transglycosylase B